MMMRGLPRSIKSTSLYRGALPEAFRRGIINFLPIAHSNANREFTSIAGRPNVDSTLEIFAQQGRRATPDPEVDEFTKLIHHRSHRDRWPSSATSIQCGVSSERRCLGLLDLGLGPIPRLDFVDQWMACLEMTGGPATDLSGFRTDLDHTLMRDPRTVHSIKSKLIAFALLATLVPSVGLGLLSFWGYQAVLNDNVSHELHMLA
ncbi:MAG: hypothetical protein ABWY07_12500, partial [Burkholderiales bacterium]